MNAFYLRHLAEGIQNANSVLPKVQRHAPRTTERQRLYERLTIKISHFHIARVHELLSTELSFRVPSTRRHLARLKKKSVTNPRGISNEG